jgi:hypothetical protein
MYASEDVVATVTSRDVDNSRNADKKVAITEEIKLWQSRLEFAAGVPPRTRSSNCSPMYSKNASK